MSIHLNISGQAESVLRAEAETMGISATALAKAVIVTAAAENTIPELIAGVDLEFFQAQLLRHRGRYPLHTFRGRRMSVREIADELGMSQFTLRARLKAGWPLEKAISMPVVKRGRA